MGVALNNCKVTHSQAGSIGMRPVYYSRARKMEVLSDLDFNPDDDCILDGLMEQATYNEGKIVTSTQKARKATQKSETNRRKEPRKAKQRKMLTKKEVDTVTKSISDISIDSMMQQVETNIKVECDQLSDEMRILEFLLHDKDLLRSLVLYHHTTFVTLYNQFNKGKEKFLHFQVEWFKYCSIFLLPKHSSLDCVVPDPTEEMNSVRCNWQKFCGTYYAEDTLLSTNPSEEERGSYEQVITKFDAFF